MSPPLLVKVDIAKGCGKLAYERGLNYWRRGLVLEIDWDPATLMVSAKTAGSGRRIYAQAIRLTPESRSFAGQCSCPVAWNCKHVAAALLAWLELGSAAPTDVGQSRPASQLVEEWRRQVEGLLPAANPAPLRKDDQSLLYVLKPQGEGPRQRISLYYYKCRRLNSGRWGKPLPVAASQLSNSYGYGYRPFWLQQDDLDLVNLAALLTGASSIPTLQGDLGALLLKRLMKSGRCFWEREDATPLTLGEVREASFAWDEGGDLLRLRATLTGGSEDWLPLPVDPPWYLVPGKGLCGPIATSLPGPLFNALCRLPPVPAAESALLARTLLPVLPAGAIPLPTALPVRTFDASPIPLLTLRGERERSGHLVHVARLSFLYGEVALPPWQPGASQTEVVTCKGEEWLITRRPAEENLRQRELSHFQFAPAGIARVGAPGHCDLVCAPGTLVDSALAWRAFLDAVPTLEEGGWRIAVDDSFKLRFETATTLHAEIDESQTGWFDIGMDLVLGEARIPLLGILTRWLEMGGDPEQTLMLSIDNDEGRWVEVPREMLQPILATLLELYDRPHLDPHGRLRLAEQLAPTIDNLARQFDTQAVSLVWQGGQRLRELAERLRDFRGVAAVEPPTGLTTRLRPYQRHGLAWLQFLRDYGFGGILADDMGLGKTVQTLAHLLVEKESGRLDRPALVVAPTSVLGNWWRETERFAPGLRTLILHGGQRRNRFDDLAAFDLIITSYPLLWRDEEFLRKIDFHLVILDEAQTIKNPRAKWTQVACQLKSRHRLCLTGTPLENHLGELWSLLHFLMPGFLGDEPRFNRLFRSPIEKHADPKSREELSRRIAPFLLRRLKEEVAAELPPKSEIVQTVELGEAQRRLYETIRVAMADRVGSLLREKGLTRSRIEVLDALLKLRQACCDPRLVKLPSAGKVKQSTKLELLLEMIEELIDEGRRVLLFSQFTSMLTLIEDELHKRLIRFVKLTGQTRHRDRAIAAFQGGEVQLFLISLKAGGVGLNLTAADTVIHYDPWWNPAVERQATDRAHRIGQDKPVFVYKLVAAGTVEEKILQMQARKEQLADGIYRGKAKDTDDPGFLTAEELLGLFAR